LAWPDLALSMTLIDAGIICLMFAMVDLIVAASIRRESTRSARKIGLLGALGASCGVVMIATTFLRLTPALVVVMLWLVTSGAAVALCGTSFGRRARASGILAQFGAGQFLLAFALATVHPTGKSGLEHAALIYAFMLAVALTTLGLSLRREKLQRQPADLEMLT
jgi:hypothetical protein